MRGHHFNPTVTGIATMAAMMVVAGAIFVSGIPGGPQLPLISPHVVEIKVQLSDADALAPHAGVQIAGVKVGEVRKVDAIGNAAMVTMAIEPQFADIHSDAMVFLRPHGLFGPKYIDLSPGTKAAPLLRDNDVIPGEQTVLPVDLDQVLHELQAPERERLQTAIVELGKASAGRGVDFNQLVAAANTLTGTLDSPIKRLASVSTNLDDMLVKDESFNASFAQAPLDQLVANNNRTLAAFAANSDHLQSLLVHADSVLTELDKALNDQGGSIRAFLEIVPSTIDKLDRFNDLLALFASNFRGLEPGVTDITSGLIAAIENPRSAASSYDPCVPGTANCPADGKRHYLRIQSFNVAPELDLTPLTDPVLKAIKPICDLGRQLHVNPPKEICPAAASGLASAPQVAPYWGGGMATLGSYLSP
jgi:phospholipid/cholesterol/gamma-HCH transport system substrate-binding protein